MQDQFHTFNMFDCQAWLARDVILDKIQIPSDSEIEKTIPMRRLGGPEDVANACLFVASEASNWISGSNLVIHGGGENPSYLSATTAFESNHP